MQAAQERAQVTFDKGRRLQEFVSGDQVLLRSTNLRLKGTVTRKLLPKWIGPFKVLKKVGDLAYELELPSYLPVHNVFHTE